MQLSPIFLQTGNMKERLLQRSCIWFCIKRGLTLDQTVVDMQAVFMGRTLALPHIWHWWKDFTNGTRTAADTEDRHRSGWPKTARDGSHIQAVKDLVLTDRRIMISQLELQTDISRRSIHQILQKDLKLSKIAAKFVPRMFSPFDKERRVECSEHWLQRLTADTGIIKRIVTGDKSQRLSLVNGSTQRLTQGP